MLIPTKSEISIFAINTNTKFLSHLTPLPIEKNTSRMIKYINCLISKFSTSKKIPTVNRKITFISKLYSMKNGFFVLLEIPFRFWGMINSKEKRAQKK